MTEDDARPEALRRFELMVEEVARNASAVAQNTAAAKKSASDAAHQPVRRQPMRLMLQAQPAPALSRQAARRLSQLFQRRNGINKGMKHQKCCAAESSKSAAATSAVRRKRQKRMRQRHNNQQPLLHPPRPQGVRSCHLSTGCGGLKRGSEIIRNERIIKRQ